MLPQLNQKVVDVKNIKKPTKTKTLRVASSHLSQKVVNAKNAKNLSILSLAANDNIRNTKSLLILFLVEQTHNIESTKHTTAQLSQKVKYTMIIKEQISCSGHIVRPTVKDRDANASILFF